MSEVRPTADVRADDDREDDDRDDDDRDGLFARPRPYLFAVAYRLLGLAEDAEDVLQDAWLRFSAAGVDEVEHPRAYLVAIVTRLCIDLLRSARRRREEYVGVWLPEPVPTREALADDLLAEAESASFAFLLLLERLSPLQRAVLVLHDVFDYSHAEVGQAIGRTAAASRQLLRRARLQLGDATRPTSPPTDVARELVTRFVDAASAGDVEGFLGALAPDVVLMSDGGGRVPAVPRPLAGRSRVAQFLGGVSRKSSARGTAWGPVIPTELNARPALLVYQDGALTNAFVLDVTGEGVTAIYVVRNPDKLERLERCV